MAKTYSLGKELLNSLVETLLTGIVPLSFAFFLHRLAKDLDIPSFFSLLPILLFSLAATPSVRIDPSSPTLVVKTRRFLFVFLFAGGISFLFFRQNTVFMLLMGSACIITFYLTRFLLKGFKDYHYLIHLYRKNKEDRLKEVVRDYHGEYLEMRQHFHFGLRIIEAEMVFLLLVGFAGFLWKMPIPFLPFITNLYLSIVFYMVIRIRLSEWNFYAEGFFLEEEERRSRLIRSLITCTAVFILLIFLSRSRSILPYTWLEAFWNWLAGLLPNGEVVYEMFTDSSNSGSQGIPQEMIDRMQENAPILINIDWNRIFQVLRLAAIAALVYFLFSPLLKIRFRKLGKRLLIRIRTISRTFPGKLNEFWTSLLAVLKSFRLSAAEPKKEILKRFSLPKAKQTKLTIQKKAERRTFLKGIERIIKWGNSRGILFYTSSTIERYCSRLTERFPDRGKDLQEVYRLFGKAVFSSKPLSKEEMKLWKILVRRLTQFPE